MQTDREKETDRQRGRLYKYNERGTVGTEKEILTHRYRNIG